MVKISVIIPVYNVEEYLSECLDHIVNQTLTDIEIICIDDGSTDRSPKILNEYAINDDRIRIVLQENIGLAATRNKGIELARGDYIYFMDGDDYLDLSALDKLYELSKKHDSDFIMFKLRNFDDKTKENIDDDYYNMPHLKNKVGDDLFNYKDVEDIALKLAVNVPGNFYKREFISDLRFPEGLLFEDNVFFTHALFKAQKILFLDEFLYNRRVRDNSLSKSISLDTIEITNILLDLCNQYNHPRHKGELYYRIFNNIYKIYENAPENVKESLFCQIKSKYQKYTEKWMSDDYFKDDLNPRYKNIYESALFSDNHREFELRVELFDLEDKIFKLNRQNKKYKSKINNLKKENERIKSTKGYKLMEKL